MGGLNQIDRTAAEAAASQSRSEHAWQRPRQLDHQVQLGTTDFVIIAEAQMRFIHQRAEAIEIPLLEGQIESDAKRDLEQALANLQVAYADAAGSTP